MRFSWGQKSLNDVLSFKSSKLKNLHKLQKYQQIYKYFQILRVENDFMKDLEESNVYKSKHWQSLKEFSII